MRQEVLPPGGFVDENQRGEGNRDRSYYDGTKLAV
jgi:hypothetical protein